MPGGAPPADGVVRVGRTKAGRGGKLVTVVTGLPGDEAALKAVLSATSSGCAAPAARCATAPSRCRATTATGWPRTSARTGHRVKLTGG